jgi:hypothetical protein
MLEIEAAAMRRRLYEVEIGPGERRVVSRMEVPLREAPKGMAPPKRETD